MSPELAVVLAAGITGAVSLGAQLIANANARKLAAAERMEFDAEHTKGLVGRRAKRIVECAPKKRAHKS